MAIVVDSSSGTTTTITHAPGGSEPRLETRGHKATVIVIDDAHYIGPPKVPKDRRKKWQSTYPRGRK